MLRCPALKEMGMCTDKWYVWYMAEAVEWTRWGLYRGSGFEVGHGAKGIGFSGGGSWYMREAGMYVY